MDGRTPKQSSGPLRSRLFRDDPELTQVAGGRLRLGRKGDPQVPAPIRSQGRAVAKVQQALAQLGYGLPRSGADGRYGDETYQVVLAYKRRHNIRTGTGYLDGIVGPKTIAHLDAALIAREPVPPCSIPGVTRGTRPRGAPGGVTGSARYVPGATCGPAVVPVVVVPGILGTRLIEPGTGAGVWDPTGRLTDFSVNFPRLNNPAPLAENETGTNLPGRRPLPPDLARVPHFNNLVYEFYGPLVESLVRPPFLPMAAAAGGRPVYVAGYDWRQSVRSTSTRIRSVVEEALRQTGAHEVIIVAHSLGGLASRFFLRGVVTLPGGAIRPAASVVRHLVLLASPNHGAPQAYRQLKVGLERRDGQLYWIFTLRAPGMSSRDMMRNWDSVYELLPHQAYCSRFPNWLTFDTRAAGIGDASVADTVYANPHVGFLERPNPVIAARLASRSRVDAALNCFFPTPTTLLSASHAATETGGDVRRGTLYGFNMTVRTGPGDETVPEFSGRAGACPGRSIARISRPAAHRTYAVDPAVVREVQHIVLTAPPLPSIPPARPPAPVRRPSRRPLRGPRPSGQPILAARAPQPSR